MTPEEAMQIAMMDIYTPLERVKKIGEKFKKQNSISQAYEEMEKERRDTLLGEANKTLNPSQDLVSLADVIPAQDFASQVYAEMEKEKEKLLSGNITILSDAITTGLYPSESILDIAFNDSMLSDITLENAFNSEATLGLKDLAEIQNEMLHVGMYGTRPCTSNYHYRRSNKPIVSHGSYQGNIDTPKKKEAVKRVAKKAIVENISRNHERQRQTIMEEIKLLELDPLNLKRGEKAKVGRIWKQKYNQSDSVFRARWKELCSERLVYSLFRTGNHVSYR